jgi:hypothetical protein
VLDFEAAAQLANVRLIEQPAPPMIDADVGMPDDHVAESPDAQADDARRLLARGGDFGPIWQVVRHGEASRL